MDWLSAPPDPTARRPRGPRLPLAQPIPALVSPPARIFSRRSLVEAPADVGTRSPFAALQDRDSPPRGPAARGGRPVGDGPQPGTVPHDGPPGGGGHGGAARGRPGPGGRGTGPADRGRLPRHDRHQAHLLHQPGEPGSRGRRVRVRHRHACGRAAGQGPPGRPPPADRGGGPGGVALLDELDPHPHHGGVRRRPGGHRGLRRRRTAPRPRGHHRGRRRLQVGRLQPVGGGGGRSGRPGPGGAEPEPGGPGAGGGQPVGPGGRGGHRRHPVPGASLLDPRHPGRGQGGAGRRRPHPRRRSPWSPSPMPTAGPPSAAPTAARPSGSRSSRSRAPTPSTSTRPSRRCWPRAPRRPGCRSPR